MGKEKNKGEEEVPLVPKDWDRCHAYMENKKRYCRQRPQPPSKYCGNHQHLDSLVGERTGRKRISCPIDPSHYIFEDQVEKHVRICPRVKKRKRQEGQPYFVSEINMGGHGSLFSSEECQNDSNEVEWAQQLALRVLEVYSKVFGDGKSLKPVRSLTARHIHDMIQLRDHSQQELDAGIENGFESNRIKSGGSRHIPQLASLVGNLRHMGFLPHLRSAEPSGSQQVYASKEKPILLIEMGAGRGMFGLTAAGVAGANEMDTRLVMVERTGSRSKADKIFRTQPLKKANESQRATYFKLDKIKWSRIECDLSHVSLSTVLQEDEVAKDTNGAIIIAKHLCGVGTDLALKSMKPVNQKIRGCLFATCCHGICNWNDYVGRDYLQREMKTESIAFGPMSFNLMRRWCAATVASDHISASEGNGTQKSNSTRQDDGPVSDTDHPAPTEADEHGSTSVSSVVKTLKLQCGIQGLGRACQRLIDYGRLEYLRREIFVDSESRDCVEMCHYVPSEVSPQNACLIYRPE